MAEEPFGVMLARLRKRAGLSQNRLARLAGVDPAYVNRIERERPQQTTPSRRVMLGLADGLDLGDLETDRLLFTGGLAPMVDWQAIALDQARRLELLAEALTGYAGLPSGGQREPLPLRRRAV